MPYRAAKISFDGSHYIATPKENFPHGYKRRRTTRPLSVEEIEKKEQFEVAYKESQKLPRKERKAYMRKAMEETIPDKEHGKNMSSGTTNVKRQMPFAVKFVLPRKHIYRNGVSFALLPTRISCIRKRVSTCPRTSFRTLWTKTLFVLTG